MISKGKLKNLTKRDNGQCLKCKTKENLTVDHIVPQSVGGKNCLINLQVLCKTCNEEKGNEIVVYNNFTRSKQYAARFK